MPWQGVVVCVEDLTRFMLLAAGAMPLPTGVATRLHRRWVAHHDLPDARACKRLAFTVNRYHDDLEVDIPDLGAMWRRRDWRRLLNRIDHLPRTSWYSMAVANDEEHAEALARAQGVAKKDDGPYRPPMTYFSPEYEMLMNLVNEVRLLRGITVAVNTAKGKASSPEMLQGPSTAYARVVRRVDKERMQKQHNRLVSALLPQKPSATGDVG
jgi:hypothetical protein